MCSNLCLYVETSLKSSYDRLMYGLKQQKSTCAPQKRYNCQSLVGRNMGVITVCIAMHYIRAVVVVFSVVVEGIEVLVFARSATTSTLMMLMMLLNLLF